MIANGYVSVDRKCNLWNRSMKNHISIWKNKRKQKYGIWHDLNDKALTANTIENLSWILIIGICVVFILALSVFTYYMLKGFQEITKIQSESIHLAGKERELRKSR